MLWVFLNHQPVKKKMMSTSLIFQAVSLMLTSFVSLYIHKIWYISLKTPTFKFYKYFIWKLFSVLNLNFYSSFAAAAPEFGKLNKPKVRCTKPWGPSPSMKSASRNGCREAQSNVHVCYPVSVTFVVKRYIFATWSSIWWVKFLW